MHRFRYKLSTLLILLMLLAVALIWADWPRRSAELFVSKHYRSHIQVENPFKKDTTDFINFEEKTKPGLLQKERERVAMLKLVPHKRSVVDLLVGRQTFDFGMEEFTICRGVVVAGPTSFFESGVRFHR